MTRFAAALHSNQIPRIHQSGDSMKYMCLAYEDEQDLKDLSRSEWHALRRETLDYVESLRRSGRLLSTHALKSPATAKTTRVRNGDVSVTDGPFAETKEQIGGFFIIEAENFEEALRMASDWPSARIGSIEVRPLEEELSLEGRYR